MAGFIGQVPEEVDALAQDFETKASDIENLISALKARLGGTTWVGTDRSRFEGDWDGQLSSSLRSVSSALRDAAMTARGNAEQQRTASS
ncbi:WXG100 family type VII secretion target [Cryobacterium cryoconiti]|jgi:uncharacterized protein YukE|uniref:WXG100 family type VII secretion target n=1 Tax=Cryobacterium cryoconiti TaxID=1259239 RepID=A0A4Y8JYV4_9MICO|nr:WXG100 family type VII secretion target [Cryobacterium cryoconiti]TFD32235.1 hypothetical protein E3T49_04535 [Cryobacterium cryoconiti]